MIPAAPGTYVLVLHCSENRSIRVGRLGSFRLRPGWYLYVGSAFGPGGLRARIAHHRRRAERPHWHVDYLRRHTRLVAVWYCCGAKCEHDWAAQIGAMPGAEKVLSGFGSSDCECETHLCRFEESPGPSNDIEKRLVPSARRRLAVGRQQLLASMVLMGVNRVVVKGGTTGS